MANPIAKTATDANGQKIRVGDRVEAMDIYSKEWSGRIVEVVGIHRQGADGTIVTTTPAPIADYPHHFSHQASKTATLNIVESRSAICEKVVVGTREVESEEPDPIAVAQIPKIKVKRQVEIVEWRCPELLDRAEANPRLG